MINPECIGPLCNAHGQYYTDDGEVLDNTGKLNSYDYTLSSADRTKLTLTVKWNMQAGDKINKNDELETIRIYGVSHFGFTGTW